MDNIPFASFSLMIFTIYLGIICTLSENPDLDMIKYRDLRIEKNNQTGYYVAFSPYTRLNNCSDKERYLKEYRIVVEDYEKYCYTCIFNVFSFNLSEVQLYQTIEIRYSKNLLKQGIVFAGCPFGIATIPFAIFLRFGYSLVAIYFISLFIICIFLILGYIFNGLCSFYNYLIVKKDRDLKPKQEQN